MENTFDFIINDEDEVMLLIYAREGTPESPVISINPNDGTAILARNEQDEVFMREIPDEIIEKLQTADKMLVCELSQENKAEDTKIVNAYEVEVDI